MIHLTNISKTFYPGTPREIKALKEINLHIEQGEFVVVIGSNGSGKSTLLNAIAGNIMVNEGNIAIDGNDVTRKKDFERSKYIARIFQDPFMGTASELSILDNFRLAALRTRRKLPIIGIDAQFLRTVKDKIAMLGLGLENKLEQPMGALSGGQRQALTLIMAIMDEPKILLLDEPSAALDPKTSEIIMQKAKDIITEFKLTALLITHQLKDAQTYGNRIIMLETGSVSHDLKGEEKAQLSTTDLVEWF